MSDSRVSLLLRALVVARRHLSSAQTDRTRWVLHELPSPSIRS